jgi:hypothetical protein
MTETSYPKPSDLAREHLALSEHDLRGERDAYRALLCAALDRMHAMVVAYADLNARYTRLLDDHRALRRDQRS